MASIDRRDETTVLARLAELLADTWRDHPARVGPDVPLRDQGIDSASLVAFLGRLERAFDLELEPDVPVSALRSLRSIAALLAGGRAAAARGTRL